MVANIIMAQGVAKFFINMSFSSIYVYSSELFPTVVRYFFISNFSALCHFLRQEINVTTRTASFSAIWIWIFHLPAHQLNSFIFFVSFFMIDKKWIYKRLMDCLSDWLADQLTYRLAELLTDLLVINDQLTDWLCYWPTHRLTDRLTDWLKYGLTDWLSPWKTVLLTDYLTDWLTDWLSHWLIHCTTFMMIDYFSDLLVEK